MTSMNTNMDGHLDEKQPPAKKSRIDKTDEQGEIAKSNEAGLPKSAEMMELKELETSTTTTVDLPRGHRKLPAEMNSQIYLCFNSATQRKFIYGLGWDFYAMFRQKLLKKTKRVRNPRGNVWNGTNTRATVAADGLNVSNEFRSPNVYAVQAFPISGPQCRMDDFPGTILYYYEVKGDLPMCYLGLSGTIPDNSWIGEYSNSYAIPTLGYHCHGCRLAGERHNFQLPEGAIRPQWKQFGNVFGCGLVLDPEDKLAIFFTLNGKLRGRKIPISPTVDRLFPAVTMEGKESSFEANFGDDPAKPFAYHIKKCPDLELTCI